jgi:hypothetical protein
VASEKRRAKGEKEKRKVKAKRETTKSERQSGVEPAYSVKGGRAGEKRKMKGEIRKTKDKSRSLTVVRQNRATGFGMMPLRNSAGNSEGDESFA